MLFLSLLLAGCGGGSSGTFEGGLDALDARVNTSTPPGSTVVAAPAIACTGRRVHVAWVDGRAGLGDIRCNTSTTGTATWLPQDLRVNTDPAGTAVRRDPAVCVDGTTVNVVWTDYRDTGPQIRSNRSTDAGRSFASIDQRVSVNLPLTHTNRDPRLCCSGDTLYVVWSQDETGAIYFNRSFNGGGSWIGTPIRLNPVGTVGRHPSVACNGDQVNVAWEDDRNGLLDIYATASLNAGATWLAQPLRIDTDTAGSSDSLRPCVCVAGARVYIAWRDRRGGGESVYTNVSSNKGSSFQRQDRRMDTASALPTEVESLALACVNQYVHLAWTDNRNGALDVFYRRSVNSGIDWEPTDYRIDDGIPGASASTGVSLCANNPHVFLTWTEASGADTSDWWFAYSVTNGESGAAPPQRVNDTPPMSTTATEGALCCDGSDVYGCWVDTRNVSGTPTLPLADIYSRGSK